MYRLLEQVHERPTVASRELRMLAKIVSVAMLTENVPKIASPVSCESHERERYYLATCCSGEREIE